MKPSVSVYQGMLAQILLRKEKKKQETTLTLIKAFQ